MCRARKCPGLDSVGQLQGNQKDSLQKATAREENSRPRQHPAATAAGSPKSKYTALLPLSINGERGRWVRSAGTYNIIRKLPVSLCALRVFAVKYILSQSAPSHHHPQIFTQKNSKNFLKSVSEHRPLCVNNALMWIGKEARRAWYRPPCPRPSATCPGPRRPVPFDLNHR